MRRAALALAACACGAGLPTEAPGPSVARCEGDDAHVSCLHQVADLDVGAIRERRVYWQTPMGEAPAGGFPVVVLFQGSFVGAEPMWRGTPGDAWGGFFVAQTVRSLLDKGYAVLTPEVQHGGKTYWNTNVPPFTLTWEGAPDDLFMKGLFAAVEAGRFGALDASRMYATGISSGGYMTSRMAVSYAGRFRALAVHSASYATCSVTCEVPALPADHPPTLLLHGEKDEIVPIATMRAYEAKLEEQGIEVSTEVSAEAGHAWLEAAVTRVPDWFGAH